MPANRETIMSKLQTQLEAAQYFNTIDRRALLVDGVSIDDQPACFITERKDEFIHVAKGLPRKMIMHIWLIVYDHTRDADIKGATLLNNAITAIETALGTNDFGSNVNTLGGLVNRVWIEGNVMKDPGDLEGQAIMIVPLRILVP